MPALDAPVDMGELPRQMSAFLQPLLLQQLNRTPGSDANSIQEAPRCYKY